MIFIFYFFCINFFRTPWNCVIDCFTQRNVLHLSKEKYTSTRFYYYFFQQTIFFGLLLANYKQVFFFESKIVRKKTITTSIK